MRPLVFFSAFVIFAAVVLGWMVYAGVFFQTGNQWFQSCWNQVYGSREPATPEEAIEWSKCELVTQRAVYGSDFVLSGSAFNSPTPETQAILNACPSSFIDIPIGGGMKSLAVRLIVDVGGPTLIDKFTPPDAMIERAFLSRWPNCSSVAKANGFPKVVLRGGKWEFQSPCKPCTLGNETLIAPPSSQ